MDLTGEKTVRALESKDRKRQPMERDSRKQAGTAALISDKATFKSKSVSRGSSYFILIKGTVH